MNINEKYKYSELTSRIIGCALEVHNQLGNVSGSNLSTCFRDRIQVSKYKCSREFVMPLFYKGEDIGTRRDDFFIEEKVMVEIKAVIQLEDVHLAQAINYLEACNFEVGLKINFRNKSLEFKRVMNKKYQCPS